MPEISVIICTHNPRENYLRRVLDALKAQTLPREQWELLLIDNASREPLAGNWDLSWHPHARHIREEELGLTPARLRGIEESAGEILIFVDDDNVLAADYLQAAVQISSSWPILGAWGGQCLGEFERDPEEWHLPILASLAVKPLEADRWTNNRFDAHAMPCGAGMCVLRRVALLYVDKVKQSDLRRGLDVKGEQLLRCGDLDFVMTAMDMGLGMGLFVRLKLIHLIPKERLELEYLERLLEGTQFSTVILDYLHGKQPRPTTWIMRARLKCGQILNFATDFQMDPRARRLKRALHRGDCAGRRVLAKLACTQGK